jgi:hypothetical protein
MRKGKLEMQANVSADNSIETTLLAHWKIL